jgi:hypothetical protein
MPALLSYTHFKSNKLPFLYHFINPSLTLPRTYLPIQACYSWGTQEGKKGRREEVERSRKERERGEVE